MGGAALASVPHVVLAHCHHIIVVPSLLSNHRCPIAVLKTPLSLSLASLPPAAAAASLPLPSSLPSPPLPSSPSLLNLLCQRFFVIVAKMGGGQLSFVLTLHIPM
jgi:hypothetical protein